MVLKSPFLTKLLIEFAEYTSASKERLFVYWRSIQEIAQAVYSWAEANAKLGSVETIVDICEDEGNKGEIFYKMPVELVLRGCYALQEVGKAEVFGSKEEDSLGVKFFRHG